MVPEEEDRPHLRALHQQALDIPRVGVDASPSASATASCCIARFDGANLHLRRASSAGRLNRTFQGDAQPDRTQGYNLTSFSQVLVPSKLLRPDLKLCTAGKEQLQSIMKGYTVIAAGLCCLLMAGMTPGVAARRQLMTPGICSK